LDRISIIGLGPVGLVTAVCVARKGYNVVGIDLDDERLKQIRNAEPPFFEPHLAEYLKDVVGNGRLLVTRDPNSSAECDLTFITVGTPSNSDGSIDLTYVAHAATMIGRSLRQTHCNQLVVVKSTVAPGTARNIVKPALEGESGKTAGKDFGLCSNPEFLQEGNAVHDTEFPDRIVIGSDDPGAIKRLEELYNEMYGQEMPPTIRTTYENAELIKYANNAFLATKVSFINCIAGIAERVPHADVRTVAAGIGLDRRIGAQFLNAGLGWGGSCFPKDLDALVAFSRALGHSPELVEAVIVTNRRQSEKGVQLAKQALTSLCGRTVALLGLAFKPNTDDMRKAVSIPIVEKLLSEGATVVAYDPAAMPNAREIFRDRIKYARNPIECLHEADCCMIVTEWNEFKTILPSTFVEQMRSPIVIDGRRIYDVDEFARTGVRLLAVGLGPRA